MADLLASLYVSRSKRGVLSVGIIAMTNVVSGLSLVTKLAGRRIEVDFKYPNYCERLPLILDMKLLYTALNCEYISSSPTTQDSKTIKRLLEINDLSFTRT